jgi:hypothetical protein
VTTTVELRSVQRDDKVSVTVVRSAGSESGIIEGKPGAFKTLGQRILVFASKGQGRAIPTRSVAFFRPVGEFMASDWLRESKG